MMMGIMFIFLMTATSNLVKIQSLVMTKKVRKMKTKMIIRKILI